MSFDFNPQPSQKKLIESDQNILLFGGAYRHSYYYHNPFIDNSVWSQQYRKELEIKKVIQLLVQFKCDYINNRRKL